MSRGRFKCERERGESGLGGGGGTKKWVKK